MDDKICSICRSATPISFHATVLKRYNVKYYYCSHCGLLQTERPYWLEEAYSTAISDADTGLIQRNIRLSKVTACLLYFLLGKDLKCLDTAGGYGLFTRLMRDYGFDFYWADKYCENIFSKGFSLDTTTPPFTVVTAFEVLEHIHDPLSFLKETLQETKAGTIIFSTWLFEKIPPQPQDWWYYSFDSGQHISFYQHKTLKHIAKLLGLNLYSNQGGLHMLTENVFRPLAFKLLTSKYSGLIFEYVKKKMRSMTHFDHEKLVRG